MAERLSANTASARICLIKGTPFWGPGQSWECARPAPFLRSAEIAQRAVPGLTEDLLPRPRFRIFCEVPCATRAEASPILK
jgi:hypothetical protein